MVPAPLRGPQRCAILFCTCTGNLRSVKLALYERRAGHYLEHWLEILIGNAERVRARRHVERQIIFVVGKYKVAQDQRLEAATRLAAE